MRHYLPHFRQVDTLPWKIKNLNCILIASNFVIRPQIMIFSVFKIASLDLLYGWKGVLGRFVWQSAERPRLRTPWHKEAQHCRWALAALSPDVQQVADGLSGCVKARLFSTLFRWARRKGRWSLLPGRASATETAYAASHAPYCWWHVFQQDSAPAHRARDTVQLLQQETPEFIAPDLWPPNNPDLNPVDYRVWGLIQERVYKTAVRDTADLKQCLIETWSSIQRSSTKPLTSGGLRLRACVKAKGRHFKHSL